MSFNDKYYINKHRLLGEGKHSKVYLGYRLKDNKIFAIKMIDLKTGIKLNNLEKEKKIMKQIINKPHPNIIKCYGIYEEIDKVYIILEYCTSGDLSKLIKMPIQEKFVQYYFIQFNNGIKYLRENNIFHRDLKPKNILLTNNYKVLKIADFGLAKYMNDNELVNTVCGSPLYMAPELFIKDKYSNKTDLWSIGLILFKMLYGFHPYNNCNTYSELENINTNETDIEIPPKTNTNKNISKECLDLLRSLLKKKSSERITWDNLCKYSWMNENNMNLGNDDYKLLNDDKCSVHDLSEISDMSDNLSDESNENNLFDLDLV